jgi:hypothetical protein
MIKECGIVLAKHPKSEHRFFVLTKTQGKIVLTILTYHESRRLHPGTQILCTLQNNQFADTYVTRHIDELITPCANHHSLLVTHHFIELCHAFAQLNQPNTELFEFMTCFFALCHPEKLSEQFRTHLHYACMGPLMLLLGFYPPEHLAMPILFIKEVCLHHQIDRYEAFFSSYFHTTCTQTQQDLDSWITSCIQSHPYAHAFKTHELLYRHHRNREDDKC